MMYLKLIFPILVIFIFSCKSSETNPPEDISKTVKAEILNLHNEYLKGWKSMNEEEVLAVFEEDAMIQPGSLQPKKGKKEMQEFWFPKDSSVTIINDYTTELLLMKKVDDLIVTTHSSYLDWDYQKADQQFGMIQKGISTTVYRKQSDQSWKIWRKFWTDVDSKTK